MPNNTRQKLMDAAIKRFYRDGFKNVGIDQVLSDVGISKTAFYKHFDCKEDLIVEALSGKDLELRVIFRDLVNQLGGDDPVNQLYALFDVVDKFLTSDGFQGCIFVNVAMEFPQPTEPAHQVAVRSKQAIEELVVEIATKAGAANPAAFAQELCMIMEGAYVTYQVSRDLKTIEIARRIARSTIESNLSNSQEMVAR